MDTEPKINKVAAERKLDTESKRNQAVILRINRTQRFSSAKSQMAFSAPGLIPIFSKCTGSTSIQKPASLGHGGLCLCENRAVFLRESCKPGVAKSHRKGS